MEQWTVSSNYLDDDAAVQLQSEVERIIGEWTGMQAPLAAPLAKMIVEGLRDTYGGQRVYIPARRRRGDLQRERASRDATMASVFNARLLQSGLKRDAVVREIMADFGVSRRTVYGAIKRARQVVQGTA